MTSYPYNRQKHRADMGIALLQEYTDLGIGTILMDRLVSTAINNGIEKLELDVFSKNEKAIHLYNKYSFKESDYSHRQACGVLITKCSL